MQPKGNHLLAKGLFIPGQRHSSLSGETYYPCSMNECDLRPGCPYLRDMVTMSLPLHPGVPRLSFVNISAGGLHRDGIATEWAAGRCPRDRW